MIRGSFLKSPANSGAVTMAQKAAPLNGRLHTTPPIFYATADGIGNVEYLLDAMDGFRVGAQHRRGPT